MCRNKCLPYTLFIGNVMWSQIVQFILRYHAQINVAPRTKVVENSRSNRILDKLLCILFLVERIWRGSTLSSRNNLETVKR